MRLLDQELVIHAFAAADGPGAGAAYRAADEIWRGCGRSFEMTETIPGVGLPRLLSGGLGSVPLGREAAIAAQESRDGNAQAVLRIHHDVLNLSVVLAKPEGLAATQEPDEHRAWWRAREIQWRQLTEGVAPHLFGEARLYLARVDDEAGISQAAPDLYHRLRRLLPGASEQQEAESAGVSLPRGFALWETATEPDERALRQFVLAIAPDADPAASAWAWSRGDVRIPPLARYLLHAAKIRYELRVWQRDGQARQLRSSLDAAGEDLRRHRATDAARLARLESRRLTALLQRTDLDDLRHTVAIAADNLGRAFDLTSLRAPGTPFADDAVLAESMLERLDDEIAYLDQAAERAHLSAQASPALAPTAGPAPEQEPAPGTGPASSSETSARPTVAGIEVTADADRRRNVFVVYGRDAKAERAIFEFLRALDLRPLQWPSVVVESGNATPFLSEAVRSGLAAAQAVVVMLTPDDEVRLHPDLHQPDEGPEETERSMQPRPNVLLELGMAMMSHPTRTLLLGIGRQRPVTDLGGLNYIPISDTPGCRNKIATRLQLAGCRVDLEGDHWLEAGDFASMAAAGRRKPVKCAPAVA